MACEARLPTSAEIDKMDAASAERAAVQAKLLDEKSQKVVYKVNGVVVTAAEAHAIASDRVQSVSVTKSAATRGDSDNFVYATVNVTTGGINTNRVPMKVVYEKHAQAGQNESEPCKRDCSLGEATLNHSRGFTGLVFVDGVLVPAGILAKLGPNEIASFEVMKGKAAARVSADPAAANGIIRITTKHAK